MAQSILKVHPDDNMVVALRSLSAGETVQLDNDTYVLPEPIGAKHKFAAVAFEPGDPLYMYGVLVGKATQPIAKGAWINTKNVHHASSEFHVRERHTEWGQPNTGNFSGRTFNGYHRGDGSVGTANYWLVIPMVFCENRNLQVLQQALVEDLGYGRNRVYQDQSRQLIDLYKAGKDVEAILQADLKADYGSGKDSHRLFPQVDGIKFLTHDGGCGGTREDARSLCGLLAGYITHSNVAGATVLSLGCQNAQVSLLEEEIAKRSPSFNKPLFILDQQTIGKESILLSEAIRKTFAGLMIANHERRTPAGLDKLCIGLECGGSDGFSGISANPAIGYTSDLLIALGGSVILSEFPELCGVEQNLSDRCLSVPLATRFGDLMRAYNDRAKAVGSGFDMNPSPGNIKDGLITDAIKSAGAAKKGGTSPVADVLDYPEKVSRPGLNLLCTPGNDVESTTAEVAAGANIVLFTTGLGTPTGNPIVPVIKLSSNTPLFEKMRDIIDIDTGTIISGSETIKEAGERILDYVIRVASGENVVAAVRHGQDDFIVWKRGVSL
jgi:altronate hydrolase